jgi:hypothetical protein
MRRFLIHLAIALVAFVVGVTAATILGGFNGPRAQQHRCAGGDSSAFVAPLPPAAAEHRSCPMHRFDLPAPPAPPAAPEAPKSEKTMRMRVRVTDGSVKEIEIKTDKDAEQQ